MEHADLVNDMARVEKLQTQERLKLAKKRRMEQLKKGMERMKEPVNKSSRSKKRGGTTPPKKTRRIHFTDSVMLLESAARGDIDEGKFFIHKKIQMAKSLYMCMLNGYNFILRKFQLKKISL